MSTYRVVVDLSNKTAQVVGPEGAVALFGPGVTRRNAAAVLARHGWEIDGKWKLTSPPDGFECGAFPADQRSTT